MRYSKTSFDSVSLSVIDGRSHTYSYCRFMPQFCFCLTVNSKVFPFLFDRTGTACSKRARTHTDKAHHSQCNYHAVWLYTAFNNPCVSYSACINPAVRNHCVGSFQLYAGIFFTRLNVLLEIKGKQKILVGVDYIWISVTWLCSWVRRCLTKVLWW